MPMVRRPRLGSAFAAVALVAAGLATTSPAPAASAELAYDCNNALTGPFTASAVIDTDAPAELGTGISTAITTTTSVVVPEPVVDELRDAFIATVEGTAAATGTVDGQSRSTTLTIAQTAVPGAGNSMTLVGTGPSGSITGGAVGSTILLGAGDFVVTLIAKNDSGTVLSTQDVSCTLQPAQPTLVDSVAVVPAPTTTTVTVQGAPVEYGDTPSVTATISVPGSNAKPAGKVAFTFEGKTVTVDVKGGKAKSTSLAPALHKGANSVTAVFTPTDPNLAVSQAVKAFTVVKAASSTSVSAVYRPAKHRIVARGKVISAHGTSVEGQVKYVLKRDGVKIRTKTVDLNRFDVAKARFRNIAKRGKYTVVARYLGSPTLKRSSDKFALQI